MGLTAIINDQQARDINFIFLRSQFRKLVFILIKVENAHQAVKKVLDESKSGRGEEQYEVEDLSKGYLYPQKLMSAMAVLNESALKTCDASPISDGLVKNLDCNIPDSRLFELWE